MLHRYLTPDEQHRLIKAAEQPSSVLARRDAAWLTALLQSGLRITEFSLITLGDATSALQSKHLFIPKERRKGGKTDHSVLVTVQLRAALKKLIAVHYEMTDGQDSLLDAPLVLSRQGCGQAMSVRSFQLRFKFWAERAGLPPEASPHWLRHSRAMNLMRDSEAADPRGIAKAALGHVTVASAGVYAGVLREERAQGGKANANPSRSHPAAPRKKTDKGG